MSEARTRRGRSTQPVLEAHDISKSYGERLALHDVSFEAAQGELLAVVGPNGAGKTTLLAILAGINPPDSGRVSRRRRRGRLGATAGGALPPADRRREPAALRSSRRHRRSRGAGGGDARADRPRRSPRRSGLDPLRGNQQRINIAIGLLAQPQVLLLDEPSAGLDPGQRIRLWEFVAGLSKAGTAVIYSTHQIEEASHYGDRLLVLADGEALFDGTFAAMRRAAGSSRRHRPRGRFRQVPEQARALMRDPG